jgi:tetratricopeptide (TPR) repeat protein
MPKFIWRTKDRFGNPVVREIEANSAAESQTILLAEGCTDLSLFRGETEAVAIEGMERPTFLGSKLQQVSAEEKVKLRDQNRRPATFANVLWRGIGRSAMFMLLLLAVGIIEFRKGNTYALILLAVGLIAWLAYLLCVGLPKIYFGRLHRAADWHRWTEVLKLVKTLELINKLHFIKIPGSTLGRYRAEALAGLGRLSEALAEFSQYENQPGCPSWMYKSFVANLYNHAKQPDTALEWNLKAIQEKPKPTNYMSLANRYVINKRDPVRARAALKEAEKGPMTEFEIPFYHRCLGITAYLEGNWSGARQELEISLKMMEQSPHLPGRAGRINVAKAYLCCVLGKQGEDAAARKLLAESRKYLVATGRDELLAECERLVGGGNVQ